MDAMRPRLALVPIRAPTIGPRAWRPLVVSNRFEYGGGAGSIGSTPGDLAIYLRMLLDRGQGTSGRILTEETRAAHARRRRPRRRQDSTAMASDHEQDGHAMIGHGGGQQGFRSYMLGDMDDGLGVVMFANSPAQLEGIAQLFTEGLRAALHNQPLPPTPPVEPATRMATGSESLAPSTSAGRFTLEARDGKLLMTYKGHTTTLELYGEDSFLCDDPDFALFPLHFERQKNVVVEAFHGRDWYKTDRYQGPTRFNTRGK